MRSMNTCAGNERKSASRPVDIHIQTVLIPPTASLLQTFCAPELCLLCTPLLLPTLHFDFFGKMAKDNGLMTFCSLTSWRNFFSIHQSPALLFLILNRVFRSLLTRRHYCQAVLKIIVFVMGRRSMELYQVCDFIQLHLISSHTCASICICRIEELFLFSVMCLSFYACAEEAQLKNKL